MGGNDQPGWAPTRRGFITTMAGAAGALMLPPLLGRAGAATLVALENQKPGSSGWRLQQSSGDNLTPISAFTRHASARAGTTLGVSVLVNARGSVTAQVYRLGWYGGLGGRLMANIGPVVVDPTPTLAPDPNTGETAASTPPSFDIALGADWLSGVYVVRVINAQGADAMAQFVVIDDRPADILFQHALLTSAAYCYTPVGIGKSLYDHTSSGANTTATGAPRAAVVSLDRPLNGGGGGDFFGVDVDMLRWLERQGYDVTYKTGIDVHHDPGSLLRHKILLSAGHDEYWTDEMFDGWTQARDQGVNLFVSASNCAYWRVRLAPSSDGRPYRKVICYKEAPDPGSPQTVLFRNAGKPEQELFGLSWSNWNSTNTRLVPANTGHWFWAGSGASDGVALPPAILGYEIDAVDSRFGLPAHTERVVLADSPFPTWNGGSVRAHMSLLRSTSGAWVFASGTISWAWGLGRSGYENTAVQRATANLIQRMIADYSGPEPPATTTTTTLAATTTTMAPATTTTQPAPSTAFAPFATAQAFVGQQYLDLLGRSADAGGLAYWSDQVGSDGSGRAPMIDGFLESDEFRPRTSIARLYLATFTRLPDPGGYDYWNDQALRNGLSLLSMAELFTSSAEFRNRYGTPGSREFVGLIYRNVFDRDPDTDGWNYWTTLVDRGMTSGQLLTAFSESAEGRQRYQIRIDVIATFQGLLRRPPSEQEFADWGARLGRPGARRTDLIGELLASSAYAARIG